MLRQITLLKERVMDLEAINKQKNEENSNLEFALAERTTEVLLTETLCINSL